MITKVVQQTQTRTHSHTDRKRISKSQEYDNVVTKVTQLNWTSRTASNKAKKQNFTKSETMQNLCDFKIQYSSLCIYRQTYETFLCNMFVCLCVFQRIPKDISKKFSNIKLARLSCWAKKSFAKNSDSARGRRQAPLLQRWRKIFKEKYFLKRINV